MGRYDRTLELINRCHTWQCANDAITRQFASDFINRVRETAPTYIPKVVKEILG